jgi:DNA-binding SARP family transcriptional activator
MAVWTRLRKAQALLLYLAVEGGMHPRSELASLLWPNSEPHGARTALRNALALLRQLLTDTESLTVTHIVGTTELISLNPRAPLELDLDLVQQAYQQAQRFPWLQSDEQRVSLITQFQRAVAHVRGPFLDGFWPREETPFDEWVQVQQCRWRACLQILFDRLSSWHEAARDYEQARVELTRWLTFDPLEEEAYHRLMRLHLVHGDPDTDWGFYTACRERLARGLGIEPLQQTVALAKRIAAAQARPSAQATGDQVESRQTGELDAPLVGRATSMGQLVSSFRKAQQGESQAVIVVGEASIGKTRLTGEFVT